MIKTSPLDFIFCSVKGLHPLLNNKGNGIHPNCKIWRALRAENKEESGQDNATKSPSIGFVISNIERNMLPAIFFLVEKDVTRLLKKDLTLVSCSEAI